MPVWTAGANGLQWCEVDFPADIKQARRVVQACRVTDGPHAYPHPSYAMG